MKIMKKKSYLLLLLLICLLQGMTVLAADEVETHQENFSTDRELKGLFGISEMYFQTEEWDVTDAQLTLFYTATTMVREEVSDFTVFVNNEPVYSQRVPLTAGETQELSITIPRRLITQGMNTLRVESYIRTNENDPCEEDISTASWMVIRKESNVSISYKSRVQCRNVANVYGQLTSIEGLENNKSAIFLADGATNDELTTAALILSGMSANATQFYNNLQLVSVKSAKDMEGYKYGVYISAYDNLLPEIKKRLTKEQEKALDTQAVIAFVQPSTNQNLLIVTAKEADALKNAGRLFGFEDYMSQTKAAWRMVSATEDVTTQNQKELTTQITKVGSYVAGPFRQTAQFPITMEANKSIAAGSELEVRFRYAQNLDFDRSMVTAYIGDVPIGSKKLEKNSCNGDILKLSIPDNLQITGPFVLNIVFDLEIKNFTCEIRRQDMPWAYISNESYIRLATKEVQWLLFDYYPSPFIYNGKMNEVVCLLPTNKSKNDLEVFRKIMLTLGRYQTSNAGRLSVRGIDTMGELEELNIISIGVLKKNPIVQQLNNQLYFQFSPKGTTIRSNEKMKIEANYGATLGTAQLIYSPYSSEKNALMIVSGVNDEVMLHAAEYVGNVEKSWKVYGDAYVADSELVFAHRFGLDNNKHTQILSKVAQQKDLLILLIVGGSILILTLVSSLLIWKKHKRR